MTLDEDGNITIAGHLIVADAKGISFAATSEAGGKTSEILDDYEEGTWTPNLTGAGGGTLDGETVQATYTKIGRMVYVQCFIDTTSATVSSPAGRLRCAGFPFTFGSSQGIAITNVYNGGLTGDPGGHLIVRLDNATTANIDVQESDGTDPAVDAAPHIDASTELSFSLTYNT